MPRKVVQFQDGRWLFRWGDGYSLENDAILYEDAIIMLVEHAVGLSDRIGREEWVDSLQRRVPEEDLKTVKEQLSLEWRRRACARDEKWTQPASMHDSRREVSASMKHFIVVKLKSRDFPVQGQITPPPLTSPFRHEELKVHSQPYGQTQVEWVDGSQDAREAAAAAGYKLLDPSAWYVYGPAYRMESIAEGKRKSAARHAEEKSSMAEARDIL
jgi:hypothetical protein